MSKIWSIFDPFPRPPRDFALDYPKGAQTDSAGNLTRTMDDDEIRARYLVGRRVEGGADEALSPEEFDALATATTGGPAKSVASSAIRGDAGRLTTSGYRNPTGIALNRDLPEKKVPRVYAHELGHTVDELAGQIDVKGLDRELRFVYNAGVTGQERTTRQTLPQHVGYKDEDVPREYMAEAIRAYMTDPNWLKSVAPKTAKRIRERVNRDDKLGKIIQFNTLAPAVLGTGAAAALFAPGDANAMDPEIIQGGLMQNLGMDEGTAYRYAAEISASPELYGDVLAKIGLSDGFQAGFRAANPRPAPYDPEAERTSRQRELDAYQDPIRKWAVETLTGFGVPAFTQYNLLGAAEMAPGLGDVIDVQDAALAAGRAYDNPTWGNLGAAGLSGAAAALGIIPGAGDAASKALRRLAGDGGEAAERAGKSTLLSSQRYLDDAIVQEKRRAKDYTVRLSPTFTNDGKPVQVVLDGHHALAAAKADGVSPKFEVLDAQADDRIGLLDRGKVDDFLEATYQDADYYDLATGRDFSWGDVGVGQ